MMLPEAFLDSLSSCTGFNASSFIDAHQNPAATSVRFNPIKYTDNSTFLRELKSGDIPWCKHGIYLKERPRFTLDPLLHAGVYYVQEASSMFLHFLIEHILPDAQNLKVLDLCAAPGGKSTLLSSMKQFELVVANEIISSRVPVLYENIVKWGTSKTFISNNDPRDFKVLGEMFDVVLVDAPCSGSGLFRKDPNAILEWNSELVEFCSLRQQRILQDAFQVLKPGGYLIYSTCSYSYQENEQNVDYILEKGGCQSIALNVPKEWGVVESSSDHYEGKGYRFYPDKINGEGFFCSVFQKLDSTGSQSLQLPKANHLQSVNSAALTSMVKTEGVKIFEENGILYGVNQPLIEWRTMMQASLKLRKSGVKLGSIMKKGFVADHELAMSELISTHINTIDLKLQDAIKYLRKEDIHVEDVPDGTYLVTHQQTGLGWAKMIRGRLKNNYPISWRITMRED